MSSTDTLVANYFSHAFISPLVRLLSPRIYHYPLFFRWHCFRPCSLQVQAPFFHHHFYTHIPGICTVSFLRSRIGRVTIYCAVVLYFFVTYSSISSNPLPALLSPSEGSPSSHPIAAGAASPWSVERPDVGTPQGPGLCGGSSPTSPPQKAEPPAPLP